MHQEMYSDGYDAGYADAKREMRQVAVRALYWLERGRLESWEVGEAIRVLREAAGAKGAPVDWKGAPSVGEDEAGG